MAYRRLTTLSGASSFGVDVGPLTKFAVQPDVAVYVHVGTSQSDVATSTNGVKVAADGFYEGKTGSGSTWINVVPVSGSMNAKVFVE